MKQSPPFFLYLGLPRHSALFLLWQEYSKSWFNLKTLNIFPLDQYIHIVLYYGIVISYYELVSYFPCFVTRGSQLQMTKKKGSIVLSLSDETRKKLNGVPIAMSENIL